MSKEELGIQLQHGFTSLAKAEMTGLDDAGMDGTNGHLEQAFTAGGHHFVFTMTMALAVHCYLLAQGMKALRKAFVQHQGSQIGMTLGNKAEHIMQLALIPGCCRQ